VQALTQDDVWQRWHRRWPAASPIGEAAIQGIVTRLASAGLAVVPAADLPAEAPLEPDTNGDHPVGLFPDPDAPGQYVGRLHRVPADGSWEVCTADRGATWQRYRGGATSGSAVVHARRRQPPDPRWVVYEDHSLPKYPWELRDRGNPRARFSSIVLANLVRDLLDSLDTDDQA
jgi:hypothetical protein